MFADLHNHNHSRSYLWLKAKEKKHRKKKRFSPWTIISSNRQARKKARMASAYGQCDLVKLWNGNVRLTFNALYPIEKGFFITPGLSTGGNYLKKITRILSSHRLPLRDILQGVVMRLPQPVINHIQSAVYSYWQALNDEYDFIKSENGITQKNRIHTPGAIRSVFESRSRRRKRFPKSMDATGQYYIPKSHSELQQTVNKSNVITMVLTIEGAHALGTDTDGADIPVLLNRIDTIKKQWEHPVFFLTFAHHFNNHLCGHAHSFPNIATFIIDQTDGMDEKFNYNGRTVIKKLLSLKNDLSIDPQEPYRILIDVKHMSAKSRLDFYTDIVRPCMGTASAFPVIASHCGYSGIATLGEHIALLDKEKDDYFVPAGSNNYGWNINVCDEDILIIFETKGLLGLSFDQRIMGVPSQQKETGGQNTVEALWTTIRAAASLIFNDATIPNTQKSEIWDRLTLGSDFEGYIDPINPYPTALEYQNFKKDLVEKMDRERRKNGGSLFDLHSHTDVEDVVQKICYDNAKAFVLTHYPV